MSGFRFSKCILNGVYLRVCGVVCVSESVYVLVSVCALFVCVCSHPWCAGRVLPLPLIGISRQLNDLQGMPTLGFAVPDHSVDIYRRSTK